MCPNSRSLMLNWSIHSQPTNFINLLTNGIWEIRSLHRIERDGGQTGWCQSNFPCKRELSILQGGQLPFNLIYNILVGLPSHSGMQKNDPKILPQVCSSAYTQKITNILLCLGVRIFKKKILVLVLLTLWPKLSQNASGTSLITFPDYPRLLRT